MGLTPRFTHPWNLSPAEAQALQRKLARRVRFEVPERMETVAGLDISVRGEQGRAAAVVWHVAEQQVLERAVAEGMVSFPYVPDCSASGKCRCCWRYWRSSAPHRTCSWWTDRDWRIPADADWPPTWVCCLIIRP